jgi:methyl-accepting chemotaxis protein
MNVQSKSNRQLAMINDIFNIHDVTSLNKTKEEIIRFRGRINSEFVELSENQTTTKIMEQVKEFSSLFDKMVEAKKDEIKAVDELNNKSEQIIGLINKVENNVLVNGRQLSSNVASSMDTSTKLIDKSKYTQIIFVIAAFALALVIGMLLSGFIIRPLNKTIELLKDIAQGEGDLTIRLDDSAKNEMGQLGKWFNVFVAKLQGIISDISGNSVELDKSSSSLLTISKKMSQGADSMSDRSDSVASAAEEMNSNMSSVAAAVEQSATNINMVSAAAEEMTSTINEIAQNTEKTRATSNRAVERTKKTYENIQNLSASAQVIGKVVETITDISEQTNLLALNATIEAARAGEAGKGFAVVAGEIKNLAQLTAQATHEIKEKIGNIQDSTKDTVAEVQEIAAAINSVNEMVDTVAAAVEEQSATTQEIAANVSQAAIGIQEVTENVSHSSTVADEIAKDIAEVNQSSTQMSDSSTKVNTSAGDLSQLAEDLKKTVDQFKV